MVRLEPAALLTRVKHSPTEPLGSPHLVVLYDFLVSVKAAPHECVIRMGQSQT